MTRTENDTTALTDTRWERICETAARFARPGETEDTALFRFFCAPWEYCDPLCNAQYDLERELGCHLHELWPSALRKAFYRFRAEAYREEIGRTGAGEESFWRAFILCPALHDHGSSED